MGKIFSVIFVLVFYPALLGVAMPWAIPFFVALGGVAVKVGIRQKHSLFRYLWLLLAIYIGLFPIFGFIGADIHKEWVNSITKENCGVKIGMSKVEAEELVNSCGHIDRKSEDTYILKPRGLGKLHLSLFGLYGLHVKYDAQDKVAEVNGWSD